MSLSTFGQPSSNGILQFDGVSWIENIPTQIAGTQGDLVAVGADGIVVRELLEGVDQDISGAFTSGWGQTISYDESSMLAAGDHHARLSRLSTNISGDLAAGTRNFYASTNVFNMNGNYDYDQGSCYGTHSTANIFSSQYNTAIGTYNGATANGSTTLNAFLTGSYSYSSVGLGSSVDIEQIGSESHVSVAQGTSEEVTIIKASSTLNNGTITTDFNILHYDAGVTVTTNILGDVYGVRIENLDTLSVTGTIYGVYIPEAGIEHALGILTINDDVTLASGQLFLPDGEIFAPAMSFTNDPDTGIISDGADNLGFVVGGSGTVSFSPTSASFQTRVNVNTNGTEADPALIISTTAGFYKSPVNVFGLSIDNVGRWDITDQGSSNYDFRFMNLRNVLFDDAALMMTAIAPPTTASGEGSFFVGDGTGGTTANQPYFKEQNNGTLHQLNASVTPTSISEGNTSITVVDAGSGTISTLVDGTASMTLTNTTTTFEDNIDVTFGSNVFVNVTDLNNNAVVYASNGTGRLTTASTIQIIGNQLISEGFWATGTGVYVSQGPVAPTGADVGLFFVADGTSGTVEGQPYFREENSGSLHQLNANVSADVNNITAPISLVSDNVEEIILVDTSDVGWAANDDITLEASPNTGQIVIVKDSGGNANAKPIDIDGNGNDIDGNSTITISTNYESVTLVFNGSNWYII